MIKYFNPHNHTMYSNIKILDSNIRHDELIDKEMKWAETELYMNEETVNINSLREWCSNRLKSYGIVWIPELED